MARGMMQEENLFQPAFLASKEFRCQQKYENRPKGD
jgi:hypothetical protein